MVTFNSEVFSQKCVKVGSIFFIFGNKKLAKITEKRNQVIKK